MIGLGGRGSSPEDAADRLLGLVDLLQDPEKTKGILFEIREARDEAKAAVAEFDKVKAEHAEMRRLADLREADLRKRESDLANSRRAFEEQQAAHERQVEARAEGYAAQGKRMDELHDALRRDREELDKKAKDLEFRARAMKVQSDELDQRKAGLDKYSAALTAGNAKLVNDRASLERRWQALESFMRGKE